MIGIRMHGILREGMALGLGWLGDGIVRGTERFGELCDLVKRGGWDSFVDGMVGVACWNGMVCGGGIVWLGVMGCFGLVSRQDGMKRGDDIVRRTWIGCRLTSGVMKTGEKYRATSSRLPLSPGRMSCACERTLCSSATVVSSRTPLTTAACG